MGLGPGPVWAWDLGAVQLGLGPGPVWAWDLGAVQEQLRDITLIML